MAVGISRQRSAYAQLVVIAVAIPALVSACARVPVLAMTPAPPALPPPAQVVVESVPAKRIGPELTPEKKEMAVRAALSAAAQMLATESECGAQWFGDGACDVTFFRPFAEDYQAYYAFERDTARETGRIDSLPRLGGADVSAEEVATRLSGACEDRCRAARLGTIHTATEEAGRTRAVGLRRVRRPRQEDRAHAARARGRSQPGQLRRAVRRRAFPRRAHRAGERASPTHQGGTSRVRDRLRAQVWRRVVRHVDHGVHVGVLPGSEVALVSYCESPTDGCAPRRRSCRPRACGCSRPRPT